MILIDKLTEFIRNPYPLWMNDVVDAIVQNKWLELEASFGMISYEDYSTAKLLSGLYNPRLGLKSIVPGVYLEPSEFEYLADFYKETNLDPANIIYCEQNNAVDQLEKAFGFLSKEETCEKAICQLLKRVQVLKQYEPEYDTSYSHPDVPFTIFVSLGKEGSVKDVVRLSESILHEAMHLNLTLIEQLVPLVNDNSVTYYSPWREEDRPVRGVLHGMFVFRAIFDFYSAIRSSIELPEQLDFIDWRIEVITSELSLLEGFPFCEGLSANGAILSKNLLPLN